MSETTTQDHIAVLRARAREAGVERIRMLRREELIEQLRERGVDVTEAEPEAAPVRAERGRQGEQAPRGGRQPRQGRQREGRQREGRQREGRQPREDEPPREDLPTHPAEGVLDITPRGHGFLRMGLQAGDDDVYVSASQIRRCVLRPGDHVTGPAREARRDERYPALVHIDGVNGAEPTEDRPKFDDLTPERPSRALELDLSALEPDQRELISVHAALTGLQAGQRILVRAESGSPRFELLRALAGSLAPALGSDVIVLLIDVPPEDLTEWRQGPAGATVATLAADSSPAAAGRVARLALEHAKRRAESGADAVLIVDSLSRLAVFEDDVAGVKRLFGAGRQLAEEGAGSLTVIATTLGADDADKVVATTESAAVTLTGD